MCAHDQNIAWQVLDEESEFGGITGWCRALVAVNCFPHEVLRHLLGFAIKLLA